MCICVYSVSRRIRLAAVVDPGKFVADDHPHHPSTQVRLPTTSAPDNAARETHTESPEGSRHPHTWTETASSVSGTTWLHILKLYLNLYVYLLNPTSPSGKCILLYNDLITLFVLTEWCFNAQVNTHGKWPSLRRTHKKAYTSVVVLWSIRCTCSLLPTASKREFR